MQMRNTGRRLAAIGVAAAVAASLGLTGSATAAPTSPSTTADNPSGALPKLERVGSTSQGAQAAAAAATPTSIGPRLNAGQTMEEQNALVSPSGQHVLVTNGYAGEQYGIVLTGYTGDPLVLNNVGASENSPATNRLVMQADGNLVLYSTVNGVTTATFATNTYSPGSFAVLQDDRNLVVYSAAGKPLWAYGKTLNNMTSYFLDASNNEDGILEPGWYLLSNNYRYKLVMQSDGNLVLYGTSPMRALWASSTSGNPGAYAKLQVDGNLVVYSAAGKPLMWQSLNPVWVGANVLTVQDDGNLVKYYFTDRVIAVRWATMTQGR